MKQPKPRVWKRWVIFCEDGALFEPYGEATLFLTRTTAKYCAPFSSSVRRLELREIAPKRRKPT